MVIISREVEIIEGRKEGRKGKRKRRESFDKELINRSGIVRIK